ncbi:hypothetical protein HB912_07125 [Listeria aquatica]|uniref:Uncharacterized protein n=1 Tax=Listeria aquatica TaxID=1494960 RepID=A0A841ZQF1_9LIST|nr:hypothetical protein [Listeria aquatica]MBC1521415.1 hypothetical protein [Listeria aquatica]
MNYLIMLGNEEYLTGYNISKNIEEDTVSSSTQREDVPKEFIFTNQSDALATLEEVRSLFNDDEGIRVVLDA